MIYFITSNRGKFEEAKKIVPELEMLEMDLLEEQEVDQQKIVEKKLAQVADYLCSAAGRQRLKGEPFKGSISFVVEDTGFYLDCLPGLPGPLIKWFLKTIGRKGIYDICKKFDNYRARGVTIVGYKDKKGAVYPHTKGSRRLRMGDSLRSSGGDFGVGVKFFKGEVEGKVVLEAGEDGFGWDPVFVPDGEDRTFAQMSRDEKNELSMRRKAFEKLKKFLSSN